MFNILSLISKKGGFTFMVLALVSVFLGVIGYSELSNSSLLSFKSSLSFLGFLVTPRSRI